MTANPAPGGASSAYDAAAFLARLRDIRTHSVGYLSNDDLDRIIDILARQPSAPSTAQNDAVRELREAVEQIGVNCRGCSLAYGDPGGGHEMNNTLADTALEAIDALLASPPAPVEQAPERGDSMGEGVENALAALRADRADLTFIGARPKKRRDGFKPQHLLGLASLFRSWDFAEIWGRPEEAELAAQQVETAYLDLTTPSQKDKSRG